MPASVGEKRDSAVGDWALDEVVELPIARSKLLTRLGRRDDVGDVRPSSLRVFINAGNTDCWDDGGGGGGGVETRSDEKRKDGTGCSHGSETGRC